MNKNKTRWRGIIQAVRRLHYRYGLKEGISTSLLWECLYCSAARDERTSLRRKLGLVKGGGK